MILKKIYLTLIFALIASSVTMAQDRLQSQQFRLGSGMYRVAEPGQLVDSVNVWGDVATTGRFLIPKKTTLANLISYAGGPRGLQTDVLNWSDVNININVSRYVKVDGKSEIKKYEFIYKKPLPSELYTFELKTDDVVSIEVRRDPNLLDYISVLGPLLSTLTAIVILSDRFRN